MLDYNITKKKKKSAVRCLLIFLYLDEGEKKSAKVKNSKRTEKSTSEGTTHDQMFKNVSLGQQEINVVQA